MQNQLIELYRNGIKTAAEVARTSLENSIRLQERQLEMVDELANAKSMDELVALQSRMASTQLGGIVEFWSGVWRTAARNQVRTSDDVVNAAANQISRAAGSVRESGNAAQQAQRKSA